MPSPVIPKEQLTAYQRWELLGFDEAQEVSTPPVVEEPVIVKLPTAEDIECIQQQAAQEGFKIGQDEGYQAGFKTGKEAGLKAAEGLAQRVTELAELLDRELLHNDEAIANELLNLALAVSKQMLRTSLQVNPGIVVEVIREAMNELPSLNGHLRIFVHPDDVEPLKEFMGAEHTHASIKFVPDGRLERGGFRIESNLSEIDGQLPVRWREVVSTLGSEIKWLE